MAEIKRAEVEKKGQRYRKMLVKKFNIGNTTKIRYNKNGSIIITDTYQLFRSNKLETWKLLIRHDGTTEISPYWVSKRKLRKYLDRHSIYARL